MAELKTVWPNSRVPRALIKIIMLPNQESPAAPIAREWLKARFLFVKRMIAKKANKGGRGKSQIIQFVMKPPKRSNVRTSKR
jgi:hypothetical protein